MLRGLKINKQRIDQKKIIIIIGAWTRQNWLYDILDKEVPAEFGYISYSLPFSILSSNAQKTKKKFFKFIEQVLKDIRKLKGKKKFYIFAQSLGTTFAMILADKIRFEKIVLTVPGDNLADCFWQGDKTQKLRKKMEKQGMTLEELKKIWKPISPDNYFKAKSLKAKYLIQLCKKDNVIPYKNGQQLIKLMKTKNIDLKVEESEFLSHDLDCVFDILWPKRFLDFLRG